MSTSACWNGSLCPPASAGTEPSTPATPLLHGWDEHTGRTRDAMIPLVYDELRRLARGYLVR